MLAEEDFKEDMCWVYIHEMYWKTMIVRAEISTVIAHIKDLVPQKDLQEILAPAYTNDHQVYHTDAGDIISLFAIGVAEQGGKSRIASSWKVYNELAATRPDLIQTLSKDWVFQK